MTTDSRCAYMFDTVTGERCPVAVTANGYCDAHQHAAAPTVASLFPETEFKYATAEQRSDPSYAKDSVGHILDWGDEMTCMCCGSVGHVHPLTPEQIRWDEGWDLDGSQWVRTPKWVRKLREELDRAREAEEQLRDELAAARWQIGRLESSPFYAAYTEAAQKVQDIHAELDKREPLRTENAALRALVRDILADTERLALSQCSNIARRVAFDRWYATARRLGVGEE